MKITITDTAKLKIIEATKDTDFKTPALRLVFAGIGWGGPRLGLALDESENTKDTVIIANEIPVMYDSDIARFMDAGTNITIDFVDTPYGAGFMVDTGASCG